MSSPEPWLLGLDVDGTVLLEDGTLRDAVAAEIARVRDLGHEVMLSTGRSMSMTLPVVDQLGITPQYLVCANGALVLRRDASAPTGYARAHVETFDATEVLTTIREHLGDASYAVEDAEGVFRFTGHFPEGALATGRRKVEFDELLGVEATRVVVISPGHAIDDFLAVVERMGLHKVSYNIGWTAWLDIAPKGVDKSTGLEIVRRELGIDPAHVLVIGDGRNDVGMFRWALENGGRAVAMEQGPQEVRDAAGETTLSVHDGGVAEVLRKL